MMAPLTPHIAEELWGLLGHEGSLAYGPFPVADEQYLTVDTVEYPIQVNGKVRSRISVPADADAAAVEAVALVDEKVAALLAGKAPRKVIVVPGAAGQRRGVRQGRRGAPTPAASCPSCSSSRRRRR